MNNIAKKYPIYDIEERLTKDFFHIQNKSKDYILRLYPFALFEVDREKSQKAAIEEISKLSVSNWVPTQPFTYYIPLLILTTNCNLACKYCYADAGTYGMPTMEMSDDVILHTLSFLEKKMASYFQGQSRTRDTYEIGVICFGGEPLLAVDKVETVLQHLVKCCNRISHALSTTFKPTITINSNGYGISKEAKRVLLEYKDIIELVISFDGWTHDSYRTTASGKATSTAVLDTTIDLIAKGLNVSITACMLPEAVRNPEKTMASFKPILDHNVPLNLSFIRGPLEGVKTRASYPGLVQESYNREELDAFGDTVSSFIRKGADIFRTRLWRRLQEGGYRHRCGAGLYEFSVLPDGSVYPCHNFIGDNTKLGNVLEESFEINSDSHLIESLLSRSVTTLDPCMNCTFQSVCLSSFDCPAHSLQDLGDIKRVDDRFCGFARKVQSSLLENLGIFEDR